GGSARTPVPATRCVVEMSYLLYPPQEICHFPQFIVDGATRMDVCQGELNDCWFLSAVASLSLYESLMERVVPHGQSFQEGYTGCFVFQFWQYGEWQKVKIDDFLPTIDGQLVYLKSSVKEEFWSSLLEKAYAKLKGGYQALNMGFPHEAMVDMTGGVTEMFSFTDLPRDAGHFLRNLLKKGALINCANVQGPVGKRNKFGILFKHAYSVTKTVSGEVVELVRVHNPWGKAEWEGPWSDINGPEWNQVSAEQQQRVGRVRQEDGEFWMALTDFCRNFDQMEVCHLTESGMGAVKPWECALHHGTKYWQNPQFHLTLLEEDDDPSDPEQTCTFLVAVMQKHQRLSGIQLAINVHHYLTYLDLNLRRPLISLDYYSPYREVVIRGRLPPGHYIIIPSTFEANQEGEFILRVLTEKGNISMSVRHLIGGTLAGSEKRLCLEQCKSFVVLMDVSLLLARWQAVFDALICLQDIFVQFDKNKSWSLDYTEILPALKVAGLQVDEFLIQLIGQRYTEPDMTVSYPGFLYLLLKLNSMIRKKEKSAFLVLTVFCKYLVLQWLHLTMYN
uniref:Zgc:85932 n=1 Tax=Scleropages formosus TaxID=113540 RepID=A0A8C9R6J0_SCLFO